MSNLGEYSVELPPSFAKSNKLSKPSESPSNVDTVELPPEMKTDLKEAYDVALPPGFNYSKIDNIKSRSDRQTKTYDVDMPPQFQNTNKHYDVELPPEFYSDTPDITKTNTSKGENSKERQVYGPELPSGFKRLDSSSENEADDPLAPNYDEIGPLIPGKEIYEELRHQKTSKDNNSNKQKDTFRLKRDSWMVELPTQDNNPILGLKPRKFKTNSVPVDKAGRKAWLATPGEDINESEEELRDTEKWNDFKLIESQRRDQEMAELTKQLNADKDRKDSLLDLHIKKRKKEKKEKKKHKKNKNRSRSRSFSPSRAIPKRKMFDRDEDLAFRQMDSKSSKSFISQTKAYSNKFGHGEKKFL